MRNIKTLIVFAITTIFLFISALSWAMGHGTSISLNALKPHPDARGTATIGEGRIRIDAEGLRPNGIYTVWFVNMKPEKHEIGAGAPPYMFRADEHGVGRYTSQLSASPFGNWKMLMIVLHPNGDPTDMKSMVGGLSATL
jgi:hypothetical protein